MTRQNEHHAMPVLGEHAGYLEGPGAHLYTVLHTVDAPIARVLLAGPFASERHNSYVPWVLWARYLSRSGFEVLRYDYRGIGESGGAFERMSFADWEEDLDFLADWLRDRSPNLPLVLHGLGIGALLAARAFDAGLGESLLLWSPPASANQALRSMLVRWVNVAQLFKYGEERKLPSAFIRELEQGGSVEVEGYEWPGRLWQESLQVHLPDAMRDEVTAQLKYERPVRIVKLGREAVPLVNAGSVLDDKAKDFTWLFRENCEWITTSIEDKVRVTR